ncbi:MAG: hypothetical protein FWD26_05000 [Treponema sp.]|nr:hypothetical protein [Treponema sp.]
MKKAISIIFITAILFASTGCTTSYHIQTFSNDVETLTSRTVDSINAEGKVTQKIVYEGKFRASDYETAMQMAKEAGFTKVLSIEYGTSLYLGFIGLKWVEIRCVRDAEETESQ